MAKGIRMPIPSKTHGRAVKRLFRVFVDLGGKKHVASMGGNKYPIIVRNDFSRHAWMYFVSHKHNAASAFEKFLADLRVEGTPSEVVIVRSDDGGEFVVGKFGKLCRERKIKQEFTTADNPEYSGVAERGLPMIESAALAARTQASELFPGYSIPEGASLWAEAMNWACDAYNRTATVANSGNRSPHEMFYGVTSQSSPIPFLKQGFCKFKRANKMDPRARECFYLGPARNHPSKSKRVLVRTGKVIITRNVTWVHVPLSRPPTVRSTPLVEGEGCDHGKNREASSFGGKTELRDAESESSGEEVEMVTSEADDTEVESTPFVSGRAVSTTSFAGSSVHSEGLADAPATSDSFSHGPDQQFATLRVGEAKRLAEHIPGPLRATIFKGRTRAEERRSKNTAQTSLMSEKNELDIALHVEEENTLEQALQVDIEASVEMPTGKMQDLPPPPMTQEEVRRSPFRKAFEHSQKVELNGLLAVGCFKVVDKKDMPKGRKVVGSRWVHTCKGDGHGNCLKTRSRVVAKRFTQVQDVDYHETTSPAPASAPVKMIAAIANEKGCPFFTLMCLRRLYRHPLRSKFICASPPVAVNSLAKS